MMDGLRTYARGWARRTAALAILGILGLHAAASAQTGRQFYAAPAGSPANDGSIARPLDLATALSSSSPLRAGDTLWLRGGRYVGNFTSRLTGTPSAPIVVRQYPGERATIDAATANRTAPALSVAGADTWYWGFEVTDTTTARQTADAGADPKRATSIDVTGPRTRFINMVVHDGLQGFGFWTPAVDAVIYGSIIANVGVEAPDRGHGHSIYVQNDAGVKRIVDNILLYSFSFGIHAYTQGARVDNIHIEGNTIVGAGLLSARSGAKANVVTGGNDGADFTRALNNVLYYPTLDGRGLDLDYGTPCSSPEIRGNYAVAETPINVLRCANVTMTGNTFYGSNGSLPSLFPNNTYYSARPTGVRTFVRPNAYEPGRANITILNWDRAASVAVDLSSANLPQGTPYEIRDAQNFYGAPVAAGTYTGAAVTVPMTGLTASPAIGNVPVVLPHTAPQFGTFVLLPTSAAPPTVPPPTSIRLDAAVPAAGAAGGGYAVTLKGAGFSAGALVTFGGVAATGVVVQDAATITVTAPPHTPGAVEVTVSNGGTAASRAGGFTYLPAAPVLQPIGVAGNQVTLAWSAGATPVRGFYLVAGATPGGSEFGPFAMGLGTQLVAVVAPGRYYARIVADTDWGLLTSNEMVASVGLPSPPGPPTLAAPSISGRTVTLSWSSTATATGYVVLARLSPDGPPAAILPVGGPTLTVAAPPGVFYVSVVGVNGAGASASSNQVVVVVN